MPALAMVRCPQLEGQNNCSQQIVGNSSALELVLEQANWSVRRLRPYC
jgi:hypothetical protein